jgi:ABC-type glycerol-3-phosphate transport system substrate-binding protein
MYGWYLHNNLIKEINMKKVLSFTLVLVLLAAMFAGCTDTGAETSSSPSTSPTATAGGSASPDASPTTTQEGGAISFAAGDIAPAKLPTAADTNLAVNSDGTLKYEIDEAHLPVDFYDYAVPITTSTQSLTYWAPNFVFSLIAADGAASMPYQSFLRDYTGVSIDYQLFSGADASTNYATMIASDDLADIVGWGVTYWGMASGGTEANMIDEGFYANINDYRAYAPNFFYQVNRYDRDPELVNAIWLTNDMITNMGPYREVSTAQDAAMTIRGDWIDDLNAKGLLPAGVTKSEDIRTYAQLESIMALFQTENIKNTSGFPLLFLNQGEPWPTAIFGGMDTSLHMMAPSLKVVDGKVTYTMMEDVDYEAATMFVDWLEKGFIGSQWASYGVSTDVYPILFDEGIGIYYSDASGISSIEENCRIVNPNARWEALRTPARTANWDFKYGRSAKPYVYNQFGSGWSFSAKGKNIPLAISYADWFYSDDGAFYGSWGVEDLTWEYDSNGNPHRTEFVLNQQSGYSLGMFLWAYTQFWFVEPTRYYAASLYAYPGGDRYFHNMEVWDEEYHIYRFGVDYDWPSTTAKPTKEQQDSINLYYADALTWFSEHIMLFFDSSNPLTPDSWAEYVKGLKEIGFERLAATYQVVYDTYAARRG